MTQTQASGTVIPKIPKDLNQCISAAAFGEKRRPTLAFLVNHQDRLLLVNHKKAPSGEWTLPQEGIKRLETLGLTAIRGLYEELRLTQNTGYLMGGSHSRFFDEDFMNPVPADRTSDGTVRVKHTVFFALRSKTDRIVPNEKEIQATAWVKGWDELLKHTVTHSERRPEKFRAIARVLVSACVPRCDTNGQSYENAFFAWGPPPVELTEFLAEPMVSVQ
jgi:ADP-ribose pyrophosphatase YjhB (NUDIX family)